MLRSILTLVFTGFLITLFGQNNFQRVYNVDPDHQTKNQTATQLNDGNFVSMDLLEDTLRDAANDILITLFDKKGGIALQSMNLGSMAYRITTLDRKHIFLPQITSITRIRTNYFFTAVLQEDNAIFKIFGSLNPAGQLTWLHKYLPATTASGINSPFLMVDFHNFMYLGTNQRVFNRSLVTLAKANDAGLLEWSTNYVNTRDSISGRLQNTTLTNLTFTQDSTLSVSGNVQDTFFRVPFIMECDTLGNVLWSKIYVDTLDNYFISENVESVKLSDSTYVFAGSMDSLNSMANSFGYVVRTDTSGNVVWAQKLDFGENTFTKLNNLVIGNDNKIVVSGIMRDSLSGPDFNWMVKLDLTGNKEWVKKYPRINIDREINGNLVSAMDNGYAIFSTVDDGDNYLNIIKTDINGETTCETDYPDDILTPITFIARDLFWVKFDTAKIEKTDAKTDEYILNIPIVTLNRNPTYCPKDTINHVFDATVEDAVFYEWSTGVKGDSTSMITVMDTEQYTVIVTIDNGRECFTLCDTAQLRRYSTPNAQISYSLGDFCTTGLVTLSVGVFAEAGVKSVVWNTGETTTQIKVGSAGTYSVTVTDNCDEFVVAMFDLNRMPEIVTSVFITEDFSNICQTGQGVLEAIDNSFGLLPKLFKWSNDSTSQVINIAEGGTYCVTVTDLCGNTATSCITIAQSRFRQVKIDEVIVDFTQLCVNATVSAEVFFTGDGNILWSTGQTSKVIVVGQDVTSLTVTISDKVCPNNSDSRDVPLPKINFLPPIEIGFNLPVICINNQITLTVLYDKNILRPLDADIRWNTGETTETIQINENGTYSVTITDKNCAINTQSKSINFIFPLPSVGIEPDSSALCSEGTIRLNAILNDDSAPIQNPAYVWNTGATTSSIIIRENGKYSVTVTDPQCVKNTATAEFDFAFPDAGLRFAAAFFPKTPDTITMVYNATFGPYRGEALCPESITNYEFFVFNRWGQKVFETFDIETEWNGTMNNDDKNDNPPESYIWAVRYSLFGKEHTDHGDVLLLRRGHL